MPVDQTMLERAADLGSHGLRALDAIHLASAQSLADDLECFIAYDRRLVAAAHVSGLRIEEPR